MSQACPMCYTSPRTGAHYRSTAQHTTAATQGQQQRAVLRVLWHQMFTGHAAVACSPAAEPAVAPASVLVTQPSCDTVRFMQQQFKRTIACTICNITESHLPNPLLDLTTSMFPGSMQSNDTLKIPVVQASIRSSVRVTGYATPPPPAPLPLIRHGHGGTA